MACLVRAKEVLDRDHRRERYLLPQVGLGEQEATTRTADCALCPTIPVSGCHSGFPEGWTVGASRGMDGPGKRVLCGTCVMVHVFFVYCTACPHHYLKATMACLLNGSSVCTMHPTCSCVGHMLHVVLVRCPCDGFTTKRHQKQAKRPHMSTPPTQVYAASNEQGRTAASALLAAGMLLGGGLSSFSSPFSPVVASTTNRGSTMGDLQVGGQGRGWRKVNGGQRETALVLPQCPIQTSCSSLHPSV